MTLSVLLAEARDSDLIDAKDPGANLLAALGAGYLSGSAAVCALGLLLVKRLFKRSWGGDQSKWPDLRALSKMHEDHFGEADPERFRYVWCTIAHICGIDPLQLDKEAQLIELCPAISMEPYQ